MNQKQALEKALCLASKLEKFEFITQWLEDINWHSECALIEKSFADYMRAQQGTDKLQAAKKYGSRYYPGLSLIYGWGMENVLAAEPVQYFIDLINA